MLCGNKTRFTVIRIVELEEYRHYTVGGKLAIEESIERKETIKSITCRWCNSTDVESIDALEATEGTDTS